jgi:hypothetical protein
MRFKISSGKGQVHLIQLRPKKKVSRELAKRKKRLRKNRSKIKRR